MWFWYVWLPSRWDSIHIP